MTTTTRELRYRRVNGNITFYNIQKNSVRDKNRFAKRDFDFRFEGEESMSKEQRAEQIQQQRVWLEMQIREKRMAQEENRNVERTWQETEQTTAQRAAALASLENECRKKLVEATYRYNQALVSPRYRNRMDT